MVHNRGLSIWGRYQLVLGLSLPPIVPLFFYVYTAGDVPYKASPASSGHRLCYNSKFV